MGCAQPPPLHDWPQTELTSPTHCASQLVLQQYASAAHTLPAQGSQLEVSALPVEQIGWAQVLPPEHCPVEPQVCPEGQVPQVPPHPSGPQLLPEQLGVQPDTHCPLELHD